MRISEQVRNPHQICVPDTYFLLSIVINRFHLLLCQSLVKYSDLIQTTGQVTCPVLGSGTSRQTWISHEMHGAKNHWPSVSKSKGTIPSGRQGSHGNSVDIVYEFLRCRVIGQHMVRPLSKEVCHTWYLDPGFSTVAISNMGFYQGC